MHKRKLLPSRAVCERYGISDLTLDRWVEDPKLNFPQPTYIRGRRYWNEREQLDAFDAAIGVEAA